MRKILFAFGVIALLAACAQTTHPTENAPSGNDQLANPASVYCVDAGGRLEIRDTDADRVGYCHVNGTVCEEWALFRGEGCVAPGDVQTGTNTLCTAEQQQADVCDETYAPVCGSNNKTYSNNCFACKEQGVKSYTEGACATPVEDNFVACPEPRAKEPVACTKEYAPVCAQKDNGIRCITTPCPSTNNVTYSNACLACADPEVYGYVPGECA